MAKTMVSGRDYPLNQSHESCTHNRPQVAITSIPFNRRGLWVSPSTSTSSSLRSWCWCPLMATAKVLGKCDSSQWTPASFTEKDNFFWVDLIDWIGDYLGWLGTAVFFSLSFVWFGLVSWRKKPRIIPVASVWSLCETDWIHLPASKDVVSLWCDFVFTHASFPSSVNGTRYLAMVPKRGRL